VKLEPPSILPAIDVSIESDLWNGLPQASELSRKAIAACLTAASKALPAETEVSLLLCDDRRIRDLNAEWRGFDKATNVLSFPASGADLALGDIAIAYETVEREAVAEGKSVADHFAHLVVHGFFHLLGYDHENDDEAEAMEDIEARALRMLGIGNPYADAPMRSPSP
jgi:probable rRNA maturation factor